MPIRTTEPASAAEVAAVHRGGDPAARARRTERAKNWARRAPLLPALVFLVIVTQLPFVAPW